MPFLYKTESTMERLQVQVSRSSLLPIRFQARLTQQVLASTIISIQSSRCSFATPIRPVQRRNAPFLSSHGIASTTTATPLERPVSSRLGSATTSEPVSRRPDQGYPNFSIASAVQPQSISDKRPGSALTRPPLLKCSSMFRVLDTGLFRKETHRTRATNGTSSIPLVFRRGITSSNSVWTIAGSYRQSFQHRLRLPLSIS